MKEEISESNKKMMDEMNRKMEEFKALLTSRISN